MPRNIDLRKRVFGISVLRTLLMGRAYEIILHSTQSALRHRKRLLASVIKEFCFSYWHAQTANRKRVAYFIMPLRYCLLMSLKGLAHVTKYTPKTIKSYPKSFKVFFIMVFKRFLVFREIK